MTIYHCTKCGYYFGDRAGTRREGLRGQQTKVEQIVCETCAKVVGAAWVYCSRCKERTPHKFAGAKWECQRCGYIHD